MSLCALALIYGHDNIIINNINNNTYYITSIIENVLIALFLIKTYDKLSIIPLTQLQLEHFAIINGQLICYKNLCYESLCNNYYTVINGQLVYKKLCKINYFSNNYSSQEYNFTNIYDSDYNNTHNYSCEIAAMYGRYDF